MIILQTWQRRRSTVSLWLRTARRAHSGHRMTGRTWEERCSLSEVRGQRWWHLSCSSLPFRLASWLLFFFCLFTAHLVFCWLTLSLLFTFLLTHYSFWFGSLLLFLSSLLVSPHHFLSCLFSSILICYFSSRLILSHLFCFDSFQHFCSCITLFLHVSSCFGLFLHFFSFISSCIISSLHISSCLISSLLFWLFFLQIFSSCITSFIHVSSHIFFHFLPFWFVSSRLISLFFFGLYHLILSHLVIISSHHV